MKYIICDLEQKSLFLKVIQDIELSQKDVNFVTDDERIPDVFSKPINSDGFVLIDVDASLGKQIQADYYGFDIAADLRRIYKVRNQIVFFSKTNTAKYFEDRSDTNIKFKLLFGRGSSFIEYPETPEVLKEKLLNPKPISPATLHDVVTMLCDLKGVVIDKLTHSLKFERGLESLKKLFTEIEPYLSAEQKQYIELADFLHKLQNCIKQNNRDNFYTQKELFLKLCIRHLTQSETIETAPAERSHTILLIDDLKEDLELYATELSKNFTVLKTTSSSEAIEMLKSDSSNNIKAIIADWRLFQDETLTYWQPLQGYEVLEYAAKTGIRALFALTSQADYVVHHIRNLLGIRFSMFKKDNLETTDQWKLFKDVLKEACEETTDLIKNIPKGDGWTKPKDGKLSLQQQYSEKRNSPDWLDFENRISESCNTIWQYYESYINGSLNEALQDFSKKFGITLKNNLEAILIARRICIALFYNQNQKAIYKNILGKHYPRIDIYSVFRNNFFDEFNEDNRNMSTVELKGKSVEEYTLSKLNTAASGLLNTTLCLDVEGLASKRVMLPEERNWLIKNGIEYSLEFPDNELVDAENIEKNPDEIPAKKDWREYDKLLREGFSFD